MKIAIGSDHAGFQYKDKIRDFLEGLGHNVTDFGTHSEEPVDYPLFIRPVAEAVARGEFDRGIVLGGSGNGEAIVANRVKGIRCALCWNADSARLGRQHNDANLLSLGQRMMNLETALQIVQIWLETPFEGGRHQRRIELIDAPGDGPSREPTACTAAADPATRTWPTPPGWRRRLPCAGSCRGRRSSRRRGS